MRFSSPLFAGLVLTCLLLPRWSQAAFPTVALKAVVLKQIHSPTNIVSAEDGTGRLFVCDQVGKIFIIQGGMLLPTPFLNIASPSNTPPNHGPGPVLGIGTGYSERGLLGLAFHPNYNKRDGLGVPLPGFGKFYVNYTKAYEAGVDPAPPVADHTPNCTSVIAEFQVSANPNLADPASTYQRVLLRFPQPQANHNGGQLAFGPGGLLYIGVGDGGQQEDNNVGHSGGSSGKPTNALGNGQDKTRLLGKILRIHPLDPDGAGPLDYSIPTGPDGNPFVGEGGGVREEIYAYGLRNPWRFSFDQRPGGTGRMFCGDVGGNRIEEINLIVRGGNYGWRYKEGMEFPTFSSGAAVSPMPDPGGTLIDPIAMYAHPGVTTSPVLPQLGLSVTGGFVYRGAAIPALQGKFVFGDYGSTGGASNGRLMGLEETSPGSGSFTLTQALPLFGLANPILNQRILCLGEDEAGEIYVGLKSNSGVLALDGGLPAGGIYKIVPLKSVTTTLTANKDNTIFREDEYLSRSYSDALGYLYAGMTGEAFGPYLRRALISFDLSALPAGAVIQSAKLNLYLSKAGPESGGTMTSLHRLTETWGEGLSFNGSGGFGAPATTGDATWLRRFHNTSSWSAPGGGGTFAATVSATSLVTGTGPMVWGPNAQMKADVQGWVNAPASNAGWILLGDEGTERSACQFNSVQTGGTPPALELTYDAAPSPTAFESWVTQHYPSYLVGQFVDPEADEDGDGLKNQIEYAFGLDPTSADASADFQLSTEPGLIDPESTDLTLTFRRDSAALDLIYRLQVSDNLQDWTPIAQSTAGALPVGLNGGVIDYDVPISGTVHLTTVKLNLVPENKQRKFVRLQVDRF